MPTTSERRRAPAAPELRVDRVACTGHGLCATLLEGAFRLDEWGYPVVEDGRVGRADGDRAVTFCPARALYWSDRA
ncbi:MAG: ferredoxin [Micrococcales bacterium]|nr:ferredoxin [Micrococcales bacterium]